MPYGSCGAAAGGLGIGALAGAQRPAPGGPGTAEGPGDETAGGAAWGGGAAGTGAVRSRIIFSNCRTALMLIVRTAQELLL